MHKWLVPTSVIKRPLVLPLETAKSFIYGTIRALGITVGRGPSLYTYTIINFQVDAHNVVPVWKTTSIAEYSARTFFPKVCISTRLVDSDKVGIVLYYRL